MRAHSLFVAAPDRLAPPHIQLDGLETAFTNPQVITNTMVNTELIVWFHNHRARRPAENGRLEPQGTPGNPKPPNPQPPQKQNLEHLDASAEGLHLLELADPARCARVDAHDGAGRNLHGGDGLAAGAFAGGHAQVGAVARFG